MGSDHVSKNSFYGKCIRFAVLCSAVANKCDVHYEEKEFVLFSEEIIKFQLDHRFSDSWMVRLGVLI